MGVIGLWPILSPVKKHRSLKSLEGQTLAVDLSIWVVENQVLHGTQGRVQKPHLRNVFFRMSTLLQLGIKLVFVIEGEAPAIKHEKMRKRQQARNGKNTAATSSSRRKYNRTHFKSQLRECCELLDAVGVPYIQGQGEAEAMCAVLNAAGIVDACVSDDGDCFLYGATVVYKNFTLDSKDPHVESYSMADITSDLGLTRERLVALALLLGCDYFGAGVPGVGEVGALRLMSSLHGVDILDRFLKWKTMSKSDCVDSVEMSVWRKAILLPHFPPEEVIQEFLTMKEKLPSARPVWQRPHMMKMIAIGTRHLEWPEVYSLGKILPLTTLWEQLDILQHGSSSCSSHLYPYRIVKKRVRQGIPCLEVEWQTTEIDIANEAGQPEPLITVEQENRFQQCFTSLVESYIQNIKKTKAAKPTKARKAKAKKGTDALVEQLDALTLSSKHGHTLDLNMKSNCASFQDGAAASSEATHARVTDVNMQHSTDQSCSDGPGLKNDLDLNLKSKAKREMTWHSIDRKSEYVPLSQRLEILSPQKKENEDVIDLDESYTYIPLSQRVKARLGSSVTTSASSIVTVSSTCFSNITTSANGWSNKSHSQTDSQDDLKTLKSACPHYHHIPLGQRIRTSLGSYDNFSTSVTSSSPANPSLYSTTESSAETKESLSYQTTDVDDSNRQELTPGTVQESKLAEDFSCQQTQTCSTNYQSKKGTVSRRESSRKESKIVISNLVQNWSDSDGNEDEEEEDNGKKNADSAVSANKNSVSEFLQNWRDESKEDGENDDNFGCFHKNKGSNAGGLDNPIPISDDSDNENAEGNVVSALTTRPKTNSETQSLIKTSISIHKNECTSQTTPLPSEAALAVQSTEYDLRAMSIQNVSCSTDQSMMDSFVSDVHFTLQHSLFGSLADSDISRDMSGLELQSQVSHKEGNTSDSVFWDLENWGSEHPVIEERYEDCPEDAEDNAGILGEIQQRSDDGTVWPAGIFESGETGTQRGKHSLARQGNHNGELNSCEQSCKLDSCKSIKGETKRENLSSFPGSDNLDEPLLPLSERLKLKAGAKLLYMTNVKKF